MNNMSKKTQKFRHVALDMSKKVKNFDIYTKLILI